MNDGTDGRARGEITDTVEKHKQEMDEKNETCLQVLSLLVTIRERLKTLPSTSKGPRFCFVPDEAYVVVGTDTSAQASETNADPKAFAAQFVARMLAELDLLTDRMNAFDSLYRRIGAKTKRLVAQPPRILRSVPARQQQREFARLANQAIGLKRRLGQAFREFRRESYRELMPSEGPIADGVSEIRVLRLALEKRFKQVLEPGVGDCTRVLEALVNRCKAAIEAEETKL